VPRTDLRTALDVNHGPNLDGPRMIQPEHAFREFLLLWTVVQHAANAAVRLPPATQPRVGLVVKARHEQRLMRECRRDIVGQTKEIWSRDDRVELRASLLQRLDQHRRMDAVP